MPDEKLNSINANGAPIDESRSQAATERIQAHFATESMSESGPEEEEEELERRLGPPSTEGLVSFGERLLEAEGEKTPNKQSDEDPSDDMSTDVRLLMACEEHLGADCGRLQALAAALADCAASQNRYRQKTALFAGEAQRLEEVLAHLMESRRQIESRVTALEERDIPGLAISITSQTELANNVNEECSLIQGELERLTQVLFEEVNLMVSSEARAKHEELLSTQELEKEIARVRDNLQTLHRRFQMLKTRLSSSGKILKQKSMQSLPLSASGRVRKGLQERRGSSQALDELLKSKKKPDADEKE